MNTYPQRSMGIERFHLLGHSMLDLSLPIGKRLQRSLKRT